MDATRPRLGIIGGSFDPPHLAHLAIASDAHARLGLERVLFVPAAAPPHKDPQNATSAEVRLQIAKTSNGVEITWPQGTLEASDAVSGGFSAVTGAASPYKVEPAAGLKFYRIKVQ